MPQFATTRSIVIHAKPAAVHALVDNFHHWEQWSPWEHLDPNLKHEYSGPESGVGALYEWEGNKKAGTGSMELVESTPESIRIDLQFLAPFTARNEALFTFTESGDDTLVTWTMSGKRNVLFAIMGALYFDRAIAKDFDRGLAALKRVAEA